ncbi:MAG TPA: DUF6785 family protein [Abditibacteriaceae bacterium]
MPLISLETESRPNGPSDNCRTGAIAEPAHSLPLRLRTFVVGIPLLIGICLLSVYADMVAKVVQFGVLQIPPAAIAFLFVLVLANRFFSKMVGRAWLNHAEVLVIYTMMLVGVMVSTRGVIEKLIPPLAYLPYFATRENKLNELLTSHLPQWAVPFVPTATPGSVPAHITGYWEGSGEVPWSVWFGPLVAWFGLILCVITVMLCLSVLLRRQWMDNEQLRFPLTTLPLAMIQDNVDNQPFFRNRVMWFGFLTTCIVFGLNGLNANASEWPSFVVNFSLGPYFSERPWNQMDSMPVYISLAAVGFAFFLPTDLLFSLWFFFLLTRAQDIMAVQMGGLPVSIGTHNARVWTGYQAAGAYIVLILAQFRIGWPFYKQAWKTAFSRRAENKPLDDSNEMLSYRTAIIGMFLGLVGTVLWLTIAGMSPLVAAAQMGIYLFVIVLMMSRSVAEAGLMMTETSFLPSHLINLVAPLPGLGATNVAMLGVTNIVFARDLRGILLTPFLDAQKMAREIGMRQRSLLMPLLLAIFVSFVTASAFFLWLHYSQGALTLFAYPNQQNPRNLYNLAAGQVSGLPLPNDSTAWGGLGVGIVATALMTWMRSQFLWFTLNPLAYAIAPTWTMMVFWFPFLLAWIIKVIVLRFGGIDLYRKMTPYMLGLILGECTMAVFWALMNMWRGYSTPFFPWP